jgi:hypothetical protein
MTEPRLKSLIELIGADDLRLPIGFVTALAADRHELLTLCKGNALTAEEADRLIDLISALMQTNRALRLHVRRLSRHITGLAAQTNAMNGAIRSLMQHSHVAKSMALDAQQVAAFDRDGADDDEAEEIDEMAELRKAALDHRGQP